VSYDVELHAPTGGGLAAVVEIGNVTHNLAPMFREALPDDLGFTDLSGMDCLSSLKILRQAIEAMRSDPVRFEMLNPISGWGDYDLALRFLERLELRCALHPNAVIHIF
jgi:hypothetical protein